MAKDRLNLDRRMVMVWLLPILATVALIVWLGTSWAASLQGAQVRLLPPPASNQSPTRLPSGRFTYYPHSARVAQRVTYQFTLLTHCGLGYPTGPDFDGSFWDPVGSTLAFGNPPPGVTSPLDTGFIVLTSGNTAQFHSSLGSVFSFSRHEGNRTSGSCM